MAQAKKKQSYVWTLLVVVLFLGYSSIYIVYEGQQGILLRLGKMAVNPETNQVYVKKPGLHFKIPFINQARILDTRIQTLDIESSRVVTAEKKDVLVDYYAKWRINNLPLYYTSILGTIGGIEPLLTQKLNNGLRAEFGKRDIKEVVSGERSDIMAILKKQANDSAKNLGVTVVDVRIKRIDLPSEVSSAVYDRMRAERERVATEHRAEGRSKSEAIKAGADAQVTVILALADSKGKKIRGEGDAIAAGIYAKSYTKNPDFFAFYRSLEAYREAFHSKQDILVLKPDSQFFEYFNKSNGKDKS